MPGLSPCIHTSTYTLGPEVFFFLHPFHLPSGLPPLPRLLSPRWGQTPEGLPAVSPLGPGPTLILLAHPIHRGLVGDVSLPMHGAVAPPCSASS